MIKDSQITIRTSSELKNKAEKILKNLGLNHSDAINIFYNQIVSKNGLAFPLKLQKEKKTK